MLITLNQLDICKAIFDAIQGTSNDNVIVEVGIINNQIVGVVAIGEELPKNLLQLDQLQEPKTSGAVVTKPQTSSEPEVDPSDESDEDETPPADGSAPKKRKRRTKAEIEADKLAEQQAQAETVVEATEAVAAPEVAAEEPVVEPETVAGEAVTNDPFAAFDTPATSTGAGFNEIAAESELDDKAPFDIDEGAVVRAEAELLPDAKAAAVDTQDPFANMGVSDADEELFAQPADVKVTQVTTQQDGFVEPPAATDDPFAAFN